MSQRVSSRHEGDLGGRFLPFGNVEQVGVTVEIPDAIAGFASAQHTAWMLINLLARFDGVVNKIAVRCPEGVELSGRVVPLATRNVDLATALIAGGNAIGVIPVERDLQLGRTIVVGAAQPAAGKADLFAVGGGWCGGVSVSLPGFDAVDHGSPLPFGPYIAACIAAGEVFKAARMQPGTYTAPASAFYSCWNHVAAELPDRQGPHDVEITLDASLVGVGAVGSAVIHSLWACLALRGTVTLIDNDPKGLDATNLNRYSIFGQASVGLPKATAAAQMLSDSSIRWLPHDSAIETFRLTTPHVVSAVDRNTARSAIQNQYPPRVFSGSTLDLRAEILRCGPPGVGACLRCFNEPEKVAPDHDLRSKLKATSEAERVALAQSVGLTLADANEWIATGRCGVAGERLLPLLRRDDGEPEFAVAFVSVMAGTLLAAELLKDHLTHGAPLSEAQQRAAFQFFSPLARSNRAVAFLRDPRCPMCVPKSIACSIWAERYGSIRSET
jgi:ThiF family